MNVLVTGGGGFLGGAIVERLRERGDGVSAFGRSEYPNLNQLGIPTICGDIRDRSAVRVAVKGMDAVVHVAAKVGIWGKRRDFAAINITGTQNVIDACRAAGITKLVATSSPSVVDCPAGVEGVDESQPYPAKYLAYYPETKAEAERDVLAAHGNALATVVLRPHLIWGPGDTQLIPRLLDRARRGRLMQVGDGTNLVDITYIDNAADAHIAALDRVGPEAACGGKAYFISQGKPVPLWDWINELLERVNIPKVKRRISHATAHRIGALMEVIYRLLPILTEPPMTRFLAGQLAKPHYFSIEAARRDLGYEPKVSTAEGLDRIAAGLRNGPAASYPRWHGTDNSSAHCRTT